MPHSTPSPAGHTRKCCHPLCTCRQYLKEAMPHSTPTTGYAITCGAHTSTVIRCARADIFNKATCPTAHQLQGTPSPAATRSCQVSRACLPWRQRDKCLSGTAKGVAGTCWDAHAYTDSAHRKRFGQVCVRAKQNSSRMHKASKHSMWYRRMPYIV
jgi:hypothetical protein